MNSHLPLIYLVLAVPLALFSSAWAQNRLDADSLRAYGGTYMSDCSNNASPKVTVFADTLVVLQDNKRLAGTNLQAQYSYFGRSEPPGYLVALVSEVRSEQLLAIVYRDKSGQYLTLDGDQKVSANLGKTVLGYKYRLCDSTKAAPPPPPPAPSVATQSGEAISNPWDLLNDPVFKSAYYKALGANVNDPWLAKLDGPATLTRKINVAGHEYVLAVSCKDHDCGDNNGVFLHSAARCRVRQDLTATARIDDWRAAAGCGHGARSALGCGVAAIALATADGVDMLVADR